MVLPLCYSFSICKTRSIITLHFHSEDNNEVLKIMIVTLKDVCVCVCVCVCMLVAQLCLPLCNLMDCSLPGSSVHGILWVRILKWVAISFCRGSS